MPNFEYCPPYAVFNGTVPGVKPLLETHSLQKALLSLSTRPNTNLSVSVLITDGDISTLVPVTLSAADLEGKHLDAAQAIIDSCAERRFRSMSLGSEAAAAG